MYFLQYLYMHINGLVPKIRPLVVKHRLIIVNQRILQRSHLAALSTLELSAMYGITQDRCIMLYASAGRSSI